MSLIPFAPFLRSHGVKGFAPRGSDRDRPKSQQSATWAERFYVALARCDAGIRSLDRENESAAATRALRKAVWPMTGEKWIRA